MQAVLITPNGSDGSSADRDQPTILPETGLQGRPAVSDPSISLGSCLGARIRLHYVH
jgi:hypothetical protein